jgi:hypothetical protein
MQKRLILIILMLMFADLACSVLPTPENTPNVPLPTTSMATLTETALTTAEPSATAVPLTETPTLTPTQEFTATPIPPSPTFTLVPTPVPATSFYLQSGTPVGVPNFVNSSAGCNWMGLAGQVFNMNGEPISGYVIQVGGLLGGKEISEMGLTGGAPQVGPGGYIIHLADHPIESDGSIWIQLYDPAGISRTGKILLTTYPNCERNLILINLVELKTLTTRLLLPLIMKKLP